MAVVALIPTGKLEHAAFPRAMKKLFPDHDFVSWPPETHLDGFTSVDVKRLVLAQPGPVPTNLDELAAVWLTRCFLGEVHWCFDFAYVVEDLELCDQGQPELVLRLFRDTVSSYISRTWPQQSGGRYEQVRTWPVSSIQADDGNLLLRRQGRVDGAVARSNRPSFPPT